MKTHQELIQELRAELENGPADWSTVRALELLDQLERSDIPQSQEPPNGLLVSMAMCLDHAIGLDGYYDQFEPGLHQRKFNQAMIDMEKVWREVAGLGYFKYQ